MTGKKAKAKPAIDLGADLPITGATPIPQAASLVPYLCACHLVPSYQVPPWTLLLTPSHPLLSFLQQLLRPLKLLCRHHLAPS
jgi:hypothetical protein